MLVVGWQERVHPQLLGLTNLKAKIDTVARTSGLHSTHIDTFVRRGVPWVRFQTRFDDDARYTDVECLIQDRRDEKNTNGVPRRASSFEPNFGFRCAFGQLLFRSQSARR